MLSKYVIKTKHNKEEVYYHTVTKKWLSLNSPDLEKNYFLKGQELDAIRSVFHQNREYLSLIITPTWECNLRCKHCCVLNNLKLRDNDEFPVDKLFNFLDQYIESYQPKFITFDFIGGEPLLKPKVCNEIIKKSKKLNIHTVTDCTTNLSIELNDDCIEFFNLVESINVSIDGDEKQHNSQRIPLMSDIDPYQKTHANLDILLDLGLADKISLKAALKDEYITEENYEKFLRKYAYMGIKVNNIKFGCLHPTEHIKSSYNEMLVFQNNLKKATPIPIPCCKYRSSASFQIEPSGEIYDVPFRWAKQKLGTLDQSPVEVVENRKRMIEDSFVCFQDKKCMECPVIGYCWGGCVSGLPLHKGKPSDYCNQELLIKRVEKMAIEGDLIHQTERQNPINIINNRIALQCIN